MISKKSRNSLVIATLVIASMIVVLNLFLAARLTSEIPVVDGWASLNRLMHFLQGEMRWRQYLLLPHGAHLHMPVYLLQWFDFLYFGGNQYLEQAISYLSVSIFTLMTVYYVINRGIYFGAQNTAIVFAACASAALLTAPSDIETMLMPFQVVLTFARLAYMGLLGCLVYAMANRRTLFYWITIFVSGIAVTFHGAGYLFAGCVVLVHLIYWRGLAQFWPSVFPLAVLFAVKQIVPQGGGELGRVDLLFSVEGILDFIPGVFAYFGTPFYILRPYLGDKGLLVIGVLIGLTVIAMTVYSTWKIFNIRTFSWNELRRVMISGRKTTADPHQAFIAITGVMLLLSAAAVSVFWIVRLHGTNTAPYIVIFSVSRYMAYALLALVMAFIGLFSVSREIGSNSLITKTWVALPIALLVFSAWTFTVSERYAPLADKLAISAAGISIGLSPLLPDVDAILPEAAADPYWKTELPKTVIFMQMNKKAYWDDLPPLNSTVLHKTAGVHLTDLQLRKVNDANIANRCEFEARASNPDHGIAAPAPMAISNQQAKVIGYGVKLLKDRGTDSAVVKGYILCDKADDTLILNSKISSKDFVAAEDGFITR
jgi:hypothetical protein